jgi:hypothetical protein
MDKGRFQWLIGQLEYHYAEAKRRYESSLNRTVSKLPPRCEEARHDGFADGYVTGMEAAYRGALAIVRGMAEEEE